MRALLRAWLDHARWSSGDEPATWDSWPTMPTYYVMPTVTTVADSAVADARATGEALPRDPITEAMRTGRHLAFIEGVVPGDPMRVVLDPAVWFGSPREADAASIADRHTDRMHGLPNGFYIRNLDPATVILPVSASAGVHLVGDVTTDDPSSRLEVTLAELAARAAGTPMPTPPGCNYWSFMFSSSVDVGDIPFWVTTRDGTVVEFAEQYIP
jgi:hypothetical protein